MDDTFVICQSLDQLPSSMDSLRTREKIGHALKRAGVSITVTSLTDILAFAVGASTVSDTMGIPVIIYINTNIQTPGLQR